MQLKRRIYEEILSINTDLPMYMMHGELLKAYNSLTVAVLIWLKTRTGDTIKNYPSEYTEKYAGNLVANA